MTDARPERGGWRPLLAHARPHRRTLILAGGLGLVASAAGLAEPLAARSVIEALADDDSLLVPLVVLAGLVVTAAVISTFHFWLLERTSERLVLGARRRLIDRLLRLRVGELDRQAPGDLVARATSDSTLLGAVVSGGLVQGFNGAVALVGAIVLMAIVDVVLLLVTLGVLGAVGAIVLVVLPRIGRATEHAQAAVGELGAALERAVGAMRTVKASGAEAREAEAVGRAAEVAYRRGMDSARYQALIGASTGIVVEVAFLAVLGVGGARVADGSLAVGDLIAFLLYLFYLSEPIAALAQGAMQLQAGLAAVRRIDAVATLAVEEEDGADASPAPAVGAGPIVAFDDVSFRYLAERPPVLRGVSFEIPATGLTAIVGPSGAGKTTLFALLERFYEPDGGAIRFDGRPLGEWPRAALRARIGYVEQDAPVLAGSLRENLVYAAPGASEDELAAVLFEARLETLVERLPDGLDTGVGARGTALSGGERQRVAIARALLRRPSLLLLDEASSQLDAVNELALRDVVARAARERAVVAIAHRLSTVTSATRIVVLDAGRVRAQGTHAELVASDALYAELAATQLTPPAADEFVPLRRSVGT